jgi:chromosomal replication initiation ATPase DnaA
MSVQLPFHFAPFASYSLDCFITHSGVLEGYQLLESLVTHLQSTPDSFEMVYLYGPSGVGKKHLAFGFQKRAEQSGIPCFIAIWNTSQGLFLYEQGEMTPLPSERFISHYQEMKSRGGIAIVMSSKLVDITSMDPHIGSRFFSGQVISLEYPQEEELYPVLRSLLERYHIRLSDARMRKIIELVPAIPVYFEEISRKINQLIEERGRLTSSMLNEVIHSDVIRMKES